MGACYSVDLKVKVRDGKSALEKTKAFISEHAASFDLDTYRRAGVDTGTLDGLIRVVLAGREHTPFRSERQKDGFVLYTNDFDASYGWEGLLIDFFKMIASELEDGSMIYIEPDDDYDEAVVRDGKAVWIH